jgi:hypothetical protein
MYVSTTSASPGQCLGTAQGMSGYRGLGQALDLSNINWTWEDSLLTGMAVVFALYLFNPSHSVFQPSKPKRKSKKSSSSGGGLGIGTEVALILLIGGGALAYAYFYPQLQGATS